MTHETNTITEAQVIAYLSGLDMLALTQLIDTLQRTWGVSASSLRAHPIAPPVIDDPVTGDPSVSVILKGFEDGKKLHVVRAVREIMDLGLRDAMASVNELPTTVGVELTPAEARALEAKLAEHGAIVELE